LRLRLVADLLWTTVAAGITPSHQHDLQGKHADRNAATFTNQMGGSTRVTSKLNPTTATNSTIQHACYRLLLDPRHQQEPRHTSMTCNNKHADRKMHVHLADKMGGSTGEPGVSIRLVTDDDTTPVPVAGPGLSKISSTA
jgi:hypothetical protein